MNRCLLFSLLLCFAVACTANQNFDEQRAKLRKTTELKFDENFDQGRTAFFELMEQGIDGQKIVADSLAYDNIPQPVWDQWIHDYCTRRPTEQALEDVDSLNKIVDGKISSDSGYREVFLGRLLKEKDAIPYYVFWLAPDPDTDALKGHRKLAFDALSIKFPDAKFPHYDVEASKETRSSQFEMIIQILEANQ